MKRTTSLGSLTAAALALALMATACGQPSPTLVGRVDRALVSEPSGFDALSYDGQVDLRINGYPASVFVDEDGSFATDGLPTGRVEIAIAGNGISGTLVVEDVAPGELLEIDVSAGRDHLSIRLVRRQPASVDPWGDDGRTIHISGHHQVVHLPPGTVSQDVVVEGHHITVIGPGNGYCSGWDRTVLTGDLRVRGHHITFVNVSPEGSVRIEGHHTRFVRSCGKKWWKKPKGYDDRWDD